MWGRVWVAGAVCVWILNAFYGFAHGVEASGVPGSGGAAAAGSGSSSDQEHRLSRPKAGRDASGGPPGAPARRAASAPGRGASRCLPPVAACGRLVPGPPSRRRLTEADRSGGVKPHRTPLWSPPSGLTPPARSAWLRPPTRRGTRDNPELCGWIHVPHGCAGSCCTGSRTRRRTGDGTGPPEVRHRVARGSIHTRWGVPDPSSLSAGSANQPGLAVSSRTAGDHSGGDAA